MDRKTLDECVREDFEYFKKCVQRGANRLAGEETNERVNNCWHCKVWTRANKFISDIEKLGDVVPKKEFPEHRKSEVKE